MQTASLGHRRLHTLVLVSNPRAVATYKVSVGHGHYNVFETCSTAIGAYAASCLRRRHDCGYTASHEQAMADFKAPCGRMILISVNSPSWASTSIEPLDFGTEWAQA